MRTYQLFKDGAGKFGFRLIAADGKTVLTSSVYATKLDAQRGIDLVRIHGRFEANYERTKTGAAYSFALHTAATGMLGTGEPYNSAQERDDAIAKVKRDAPHAPVEDKT